MLREIQAAFREGVLTGREEAAHAWFEADGLSRAKRFSIYRLNTEISLTRTLGTCFPVVAKLVGESFFKALARRFIGEHPPAKPQLLAYGDAFPDFIDTFPPAGSVPYLADVARLEWARNEALFADEAPVLGTTDLRSVPQDRYGDLVFRLHPSVRLVASRWPVLSIWQAHQSDPVTAFPRQESPERAIVLRPFYRVETAALVPGDHALLEALAGGATLENAAREAVDRHHDFDLMTALAGHLRRGSFAAATLPPSPEATTEK